MTTRDTELWAQVRAGDVGALDTLMRTHARVLAAVSFAVLESNDLAHDAILEVFVRLWAQRATLQTPGDIRAYLISAVRNRALDLARERLRAEVRDREWWDAEGVAHTIADGAEGTPDADYLRKTVYRALRHVPPRCREIFLLSWEAGLSYAEIADTMGLGLPMIYNQMSRAGRRVAEVLQKQGRA